MLPFLLGAICAILVYLAYALIATGLHIHRIERQWTLLAQRRELPV